MVLLMFIHTILNKNVLSNLRGFIFCSALEIVFKFWFGLSENMRIK